MIPRPRASRRGSGGCARSSEQGHRLSSRAEGDCPAAQQETKERLPREVWLLAGSNVVVALGYGVVAPVLPQYARHFGVSISAATFVIT
ncbi:MAG TPA: MFS transporter, partial [Mycobacterium sp.]|nr:MFS transporter [Mycobacterium sp.]